MANNMTDEHLEQAERQLNMPPIGAGLTADPISIPETLRSWILGLIKQPALRSVIIRKTHTDFQTAGLTLDLTIFNLGPRCEILSAWMNVTTAFAGPATYTISMGPDGAETTLQTAQNVKTTGLKLAVGTDFTTNRAIYSTSVVTSIQAKATSTVNNLDQSTAGVVEFYILYYDYQNG